jgi:hypothetical protein
MTQAERNTPIAQCAVSDGRAMIEAAAPVRR